MVDREQVFISQAERILGSDRFKEIGVLVPCEWNQAIKFDVYEFHF